MGSILDCPGHRRIARRGAPRQVQASVFTVNFTQVGGNVVANGGGSFDLTGLFMQSSGGSTTTEINPGSAVLGVGDLGFTDDVWANSGSEGPGLIGPGSYGSGGTADPSK